MNRQAQTNDIIEDGRFALDSEVVKVRAAGSNIVHVVDDVSDPQATTVVVDASNRARRIAGRVWTSTGTPAIGAVVEALDVEGTHRAHATSDDRGHFELYCEEGALTPVRLSVGPLPGHSPWSE